MIFSKTKWNPASVVLSLVWVCLGCLALTACAQSSLRGITTQDSNNMDQAEFSETQHRSLLQIDALREAFQMARAKYYNKLEQDYGAQYTGALFRADHPFIPDRESSIGRTAFATSVPNANVSWTRLVRKVTLKVIDAQESSTSPTTFVWSTGGHSASAGHGNLFNESYTNMMNVNAAPLFQAVGIEFHARSYAMGGTTSAVEIASCAKEIFGLDPDIISWDYGMCDGRAYLRGEMYARRAALIPSHPAVIFLQTNTDRGRLGVAEHLTAQGYTSLAMHDQTVKQREMQFPDCAALPLEEVAALPRYVQNFRCGTAVEKGEPMCDASKWTNTHDELCEKRRFRTSWHPGWKWHAYRSHIFTLFLMELIDDALSLLQSPDAIGDLHAFTQKLREEERKDYDAFMATSNFQYDGVKDGWVQHDVTLETLYKAPNYCHTARLPAETRAMGFLTGRTDLTAQGTYDKGIEYLTALPETTSSEIPLVYEASTRQPCKFDVQNDFKDFFLVSGKYTDYASLTLPTNSEIQAYGGPHTLKGVIAVCGAACGWRCPADTVDVLEGVYTEALKFRVNGVEAKNATRWDACVILQNPDGGHVFKTNEGGRFKVEAKVTTSGKIARLSSIMLW